MQYKLLWIKACVKCKKNKKQTLNQANLEFILNLTTTYLFLNINVQINEFLQTTKKITIFKKNILIGKG